jgi:hypothetical protein
MSMDTQKMQETTPQYIESMAPNLIPVIAHCAQHASTITGAAGGAAHAPDLSIL